MATTGVALYVGPAPDWGGHAIIYDLEPAYAEETDEGTVHWTQIVVSAVDLPVSPLSRTLWGDCETMAFGYANGEPDMSGLGTIRGRKNHHDMLAQLGYAEGLDSPPPTRVE